MPLHRTVAQNQPPANRITLETASIAEAAAEDRPDPPQSDTHSFVLRVWIEDRCDTSGAVRWRGSITHVTSGRTRYFEDLTDMCAFITSHMEAS
jgi:hypothetical protein